MAGSADTVRTPVVIGLYGGVAAGKNLVASFFAELGALVLDADAIVAEFYASPSMCRALADRFGEGVLAEDGTVNRRVLADIVFADADARRSLEALVHPAVRDRITDAIEHEKHLGRVPAIVLNVPLLLGSPLEVQVEAGVFIEAPPEVREARAQASRHWPPNDVARRDAAQPPLSEKRARCQHVIDNAGSIDATKEQVQQIWRTLVPQR